MVNWNQNMAGKLVTAWAALFAEQAHLFRDDDDEETVSGAFARFLETLRSDGLLVNTEYATMNDQIQARVRKAISLGQDIEEVKPDIVIHRPGDDSIEGNLLAIEMKKWINSDWRHDEDKLIEMTSDPRPPREFQYRFGLLLRFRQTGVIGEATLFKGGESFYLNPATLRTE